MSTELSNNCVISPSCRKCTTFLTQKQGKSQREKQVMLHCMCICTHNSTLSHNTLSACTNYLLVLTNMVEASKRQNSRPTACYIVSILSLVSEFPSMKYYQNISSFALQSKSLETFSIIILLVRTSTCCNIAILTLY